MRDLETAEAEEPVKTTYDRLAGTLLGTALGDALGLPAEGMSAAAVARRFGRMDRFRMLGRIGFVSDDTEQSALIAQSLIRYPDDPDRCVRAFRRALLGWFLRLPWGIGLGTLKACLKIGLGLKRSGVNSAGNGAAMRAAIVGVFFRDRPADRERFGRALAEVSHVDSRGVEGALYVAELAAALANGSIEDAQAKARRVVTVPALGEALDRSRALAEQGVGTEVAARLLGTSGYVLHTTALATFALLRFGDDPMRAITETIAAGGDTDSNAAVVGAWVGARHGAAALPDALIDRIHDGPFGPTHLRRLAAALAEVGTGKAVPPPRYSALAALARNLALYPVVIGHGLLRLIPPRPGS